MIELAVLMITGIAIGIVAGELVDRAIDNLKGWNNNERV